MVGASNAFNQIIERVPDAVMKRTMDRPIPTGRISVNTAMIIAVGLTITGLVILYNINEKTALFGAISIFLYTSAYTPLKPVTPLSVFVGAIPGAIPFMLGWVAATGQFGIEVVRILCAGAGVDLSSLCGCEVCPCPSGIRG